MFTRKTEKESPINPEIFNNRLKEIQSTETVEISAQAKLSQMTSEPLPVPEKLRARSFEVDNEVRRSSPASKSTETVISNDLVIEGSVTSEGVIRLEGTVYGDMKCSALIVEEAGAISGNVNAIEVNVHGRVKGTVHGDNVMLHSTAFVEGDIYHQGIGIEMGTHYDGRLQWINPADAGQVPSEGGMDNIVYSEAAE